MTIHELILQNLLLYHPVNKKIRLGRQEDGGYVIVDGYDYDCYIGVGIDHEYSFDLDLANYKPDLKGYAFDGHSIPSNLNEHFPRQYEVIQRNLTFDNTEKEILTKYENMLVKMDIENSEWGWIKGFKDHMFRIKQFVLEAHNVFSHYAIPNYFDPERLENNQQLLSVLECLSILNKTHYLVHVHENNQPNLPIKIYGNEFPSVFELTYIRKDCKIDGLNKEPLPILGVDYPVYPDAPSKNMNVFPFVW